MLIEAFAARGARAVERSALREHLLSRLGRRLATLEE